MSDGASQPVSVLATDSVSRRPRGMLEGGVRVVLADVLFLPMGLLSATYLTRSLGASNYGLFTLAATLIAWMDWVITAAFSPATVKFIGEAADWRAVGATVLRLHFAIGCAATFLLWILAAPIAALLHEPVLTTDLRLFALGVPAYAAACAHRYVLVGLGSFKARALASAARAIAGPVLIITLVTCGLSVTGAIVGNIGACLVEIAIARRYARPSLLGRSAFPLRRLWGYAVPLFVGGISLRLFTNLDLFALKALGGTAAQAGIYGAAQNLAVVPGYVVFSFAPLLLSALSRLRRRGDEVTAAQLIANSLRAVVVLLPLFAVGAAAAREIVDLLFGAAFTPAAPILAVLVFGALGRAVIAISTAVLTASARPIWVAALTAPLVPLAIAGHGSLIPVMGAIGAALVTATLSLLTALAGLGTVHRLRRVLPPITTVFRSFVLCVPAYYAAAMWPTPGLLLFIKLPVVAIAALLGFLLLGEFNTEEINLAWSFVTKIMSSAAAIGSSERLE